MTKFIKYFIFFYLFIFLNSVLIADEQKVISVQECIDIALQNHPSIKIANENINRALADLGLAKSYNTVQVYGEVKTVEILKSDASPSGFNIPGRDTLIGLFAGATASYNLLDPNKSRYEDAKRLAYDAARVNYLNTQNDLIKSVKESYYQYLYAYYRNELQKELLQKFELKLDKAKILFKNGQKPILDVSKAELDVATARLNYQRTQNELALSKEKLLTAMGVAGGDYTITTISVFELESKLPVVAYELDELLLMAEEFSPAIRNAQIQNKLTKIQIEVEKAAHIPTIEVYASLGMENRSVQSGKQFLSSMGANNWDPTFHFGVQAKIPIYTGGAISSKVDAAIAEYNKSLYNELSVKNNVMSTVKRYYNNIIEYNKQVDILKLTIENARKHVQLAQKSYDSGIGTQIELQDAELSYLNTQMDYIRVLYEYYIALTSLANIIGIDDSQLLNKK